jgi:hypothetical protein
MTQLDRYDVALRSLSAALSNASQEQIVLTAQLLAVENAAYRSTFGALTIPPILPLLLGSVKEDEAALLADGMEHLISLLRTITSRR